MANGPEVATVAYSRRSEVKRKYTMKDVGLVLALMLLGFGLRIWHVGQPAKMYFDEIYYVDAAEKLWSGQADPNSVHPPLGKWLIGLGVRATEALPGKTLSQPFRWRIASVTAGTLMVGITYALGLLLFNFNRPAAGFAGLIVATEHLHLTMSRIAMLDPFLALFCLLGIYGAMAYFLGGHERWAIFSAFILGIASGCKWSGILTAAGCFLAGWWIDRNEPTRDRTQRYFFWLLLLLPLGFFLTYLHLFLADDAGWHTFTKIFDQSERMVKFRYNEKEFTHRYLSYFWQWPLVLKPIWLYFEEDKKTQSVEAICSMGAPVLWWGFFVLLLERSWTTFRTKKSRLLNPVTGALIIIWLLQWLPWAISTTGGFFYYMLTEVPIMALVVGKLLADLFDFQDALGDGRWKGWVILGVYLLCFALYFPFATGRATPRKYFNTFFFTQWIEGNKAAVPNTTAH